VKIVCAVSHFDELTLSLCEECLRQQSVPISEIKTVSGLSPTSASINACLDFAQERDADILFHTAADVFAEPNALEELLKVFDAQLHYASIGRGFDVLNGSGAPVGLWLLNIRDVGDLRCQNEFLTDMKLIERIEQKSGKTRAYTDVSLNLGYHHPIWTPSEMFAKMRYSTQKYKPKIHQKHKAFFERELKYNPGNAVLEIGLEAMLFSIKNPHTYASKSKAALDREFSAISGRFNLTGQEFYVHNHRFKAIARQLLNSDYDCVTVEERETSS
jgi:hypothetical protein